MYLRDRRDQQIQRPRPSMLSLPGELRLTTQRHVLGGLGERKLRQPAEIKGELPVVLRPPGRVEQF